MAVDKEYPKWMYGPNDESRIFQRDEQIPKGWEDHPEKVGKSPPKPSKPSKPSKSQDPGEAAERTTILAALREAGFDVADDATDDEINAKIDELNARTPQV